MKTLFLKDMRYRQARVVLTALGITVLISLILLLGGIMNGMRIQARQYVESTGADVWISAEGSGGAFIGFSMVVEEYMAFLNSGPGLVPDSAAPLVFAQARPTVRGKSTKAIVVGYKLGQLGGPKSTVEGRMFTRSNFEDYRPEDPVPYEVVVDEKMGLEIGEQITLGNEKVRVVGKAKSLMFVLDTPLLFMDVRIAQKLLLGNTPHVNMMIAKTNKSEQPAQIAADLDALETIEARTLKQTLRDIIAYYVDEPMKAVQFLAGDVVVSGRYSHRDDYLCDDAGKDTRNRGTEGNRRFKRLCDGTPAKTSCSDLGCWCVAWAYAVLRLCGSGTDLCFN